MRVILSVIIVDHILIAQTREMFGNLPWFWTGVKYDIPLCCNLFFNDVWNGEWILDRSMRGNWLQDHDGYIPCPDCLARIVEVRNAL